MEEFVFRMVERVGFPIAVSLLSFFCMYHLFKLREKERDERNDKLATELRNNTLATLGQVESVKQNTNAFKQFAEAFGSDPKKLCQAELIAVKAAELGMTREDFSELLSVMMDIRKQGKEAAQQLQDKAILLATVIDAPQKGAKDAD